MVKLGAGSQMWEGLWTKWIRSSIDRLSEKCDDASCDNPLTRQNDNIWQS